MSYLHTAWCDLASESTGIEDENKERVSQTEEIYTVVRDSTSDTIDSFPEFTTLFWQREQHAELDRMAKGRRALCEWQISHALKFSQPLLPILQSKSENDSFLS